MVQNYNKTVAQYYRTRKVAGDIGIEHEVEFNGNVPESAPPKWQAKPDGSLRNGMEFVTKGAVPLDQVHTLVTRLADFLNADYNVQWSQRCSTHIHVNVQELTFREVLSFLALYYIYEAALVRWAGGYLRESNNFCMQATEAMGVLSLLLQAYRKGDYNYVHTDKVRYASVNLMALGSYGSLEFRSMGGTLDADRVNRWTSMLSCLKQFGRGLKPDEIPGLLSGTGARGLAEQIFGMHANLLDIRTEECYDGLRCVQPVLFCQEWEVEAAQAPEELPDDMAFEDEGPLLQHDRPVEFCVANSDMARSLDTVYRNGTRRIAGWIWDGRARSWTYGDPVTRAYIPEHGNPAYF